MSAQSPFWFRLWTSIFAVFLGLHASWLLAAEITRVALPFLPSSRADAETVATYGNVAAVTALIGWPRGDLWVDYALTADASLLGKIEDGILPDTHIADRKTVGVTEHAAALAPYDSRAWLFLAAISVQPGWTSNKTAAQLKMSYYTSPNDVRLFPLRMQIAMRSQTVTDEELRSFMEREIRTIINQRPTLKRSLAIAYRGASPAGRHFMEDKLTEFDPKFLAEIKAAKP